MLRKSLTKIRQDKRLTVIFIGLTLIFAYVLYDIAFMSSSALYPQIDSYSYELSGGEARLREGAGRSLNFEALKEPNNYFTLDFTFNIYDFQGNTKKVTTWFRYQCDPNVYPCAGLRCSSWSGTAPEGDAPPADVHGPDGNREWLLWESSESGGQQKAVVQLTIAIWFQEPTSIKADYIEYYVMDIKPEDTQGNSASWQYRIDIEWIDRPENWTESWEDEYSKVKKTLDLGLDAPSFEFLPVLMVIPILVGLKRRKREDVNE